MAKAKERPCVRIPPRLNKTIFAEEKFFMWRDECELTEGQVFTLLTPRGRVFGAAKVTQFSPAPDYRQITVHFKRLASE